MRSIRSSRCRSRRRPPHACACRRTSSCCPYRNPLLTAKSVLSLDVLSGGRVILGVAPGYLKPEFARARRGLRRAQRADRRSHRRDAAACGPTDEIEVVGRHFRTRGTTMRPPAVQQPHPPIWIGGNSTAAIRRAVERGQGWVPFPNPGGLTSRVRTPELSNLDELATPRAACCASTRQRSAAPSRSTSASRRSPTVTQATLDELATARGARRHVGRAAHAHRDDAEPRGSTRWQQLGDRGDRPLPRSGHDPAVTPWWDRGARRRRRCDCRRKRPRGAFDRVPAAGGVVCSGAPRRI